VWQDWTYLLKLSKETTIRRTRRKRRKIRTDWHAEDLDQGQRTPQSHPHSYSWSSSKQDGRIHERSRRNGFLKQRTASTSVSPSISIPSVLVARVSNKSICIPITLHENKKDREPVELKALLDSGAGGLFIDAIFAKQNKFTLHDLPEPLNAYNVDGTLNKKGTVMSYVKADLQINERIKPIQFTSLG
jgi:hypothetical protein